MAVPVHSAGEILRRFSLFTMNRPFAAIFECARRNESTGCISMKDMLFGKYDSFRAATIVILGHVEFFKINQVEVLFSSRWFFAPSVVD